MRIKDVQVGTPYCYEPDTRQMEKMVVVLDTTTLLRTASVAWDGPERKGFVKHERGAFKPVLSKTGYLALKVRKSSACKLTPAQIGALCAVTANQVALNGFQVPPHLEELGIHAQVGLVQPRALVGEWKTVLKAREESKRQIAEAKAQEETEAALRVERWEAVVDFLHEVRGHGQEYISYHVFDFGEKPTKEIDLTDMEELVRLARIGQAAERDAADATG